MSDGHVPSWVDPAMVLGFRPTERQVAFRAVARSCVDGGSCFRSQWLSESMNRPEFAREALSQSEWDEWIADARFVAWFYSAFPESVPLSRPELQLLDYQWWSGVSEGMKRGEQWAFRLYEKAQLEGASEGGKVPIESREEMERRRRAQSAGAAAWSEGLPGMTPTEA